MQRVIELRARFINTLVSASPTVEVRTMVRSGLCYTCRATIGPRSQYVSIPTKGYNRLTVCDRCSLDLGHAYRGIKRIR